MEELMLKAIGNVGVPAVICLYTLFGVNKTLKELADAINKVSNDVQEIKELKNRTNELSFKVEELQNELTLRHWKE